MSMDVCKPSDPNDGVTEARAHGADMYTEDGNPAQSSASLPVGGKASIDLAKICGTDLGLRKCSEWYCQGAGRLHALTTSEDY